MENIWNTLSNAVATYAPRVLGAVAILGVGWLVALGLAAGVRAALRRTGIDARAAGWFGRSDERREIAFSHGASRVVFYLVMIFALVACFQSLGLTLITEPLNNLLNELFTYAPQLLAGLALAAVAFATAFVVRLLLRRTLEMGDVDRRIGEGGGGDAAHPPVSRSVSESAFWLVLLLFMPAVLGALGLEGLLAPVRNLVDTILGYLPNILAAGVVLLVGWFIARVLQRLVTNLLAAAGADRLSERIGVARTLGTRRLSGVVGVVVYALVLIPVLIGALHSLDIAAVTTPASRMLETVLGVLPDLFGAALILILSYLVGRVISDLAGNLLVGIGFDGVPARLGLVEAEKPLRAQPSQVAARIVMVVIMLFAAMEAAQVIGFASLSGMIDGFLVFAARVLLGVVILALGLALANLAARAILATGRPQSGLLAHVARGAILMLSGAMALREMGLAGEIINLAFTLVLGAVAVAAAIAFGLGGREFAAGQLQRWEKEVDLGPAANPSGSRSQAREEGA